MPKWLQFLAKQFPGIRKSIANLDEVKIADHCEFDGVNFQFDSRVMDKKRFVAIAAGALESDEVKVAQRFLKKDDIVVEFGSGLGIAAARVNKVVGPQQHYCFEANPLVIEYAQKLFKLNGIQINIENFALGNGTLLPFYMVDDYILSSFQKPKGHLRRGVRPRRDGVRVQPLSHAECLLRERSQALHVQGSRATHGAPQSPGVPERDQAGAAAAAANLL